MDSYNIARAAYQAYARTTGGLNYLGGKMPEWDDLPPQIQDAWRNAANTAHEYGKATNSVTDKPKENYQVPKSGDARIIRICVALFTAFIVICVVVKVVNNEIVKNTPPATCEVFGGHWTIWDGWLCQ